ncbi:hypothetical protein [Nocardia sp. NPDC050718]|uniref:hypothetical protein n=1 Tax=Nocardia sp. NPDC050718 TaxID=3155788 RepID=UPI0034108623
MPENANTWKPTDDEIRQAYIYLLARFLVIRQEHTDRSGEGFDYNRIEYNPLGAADFVNPTPEPDGSLRIGIGRPAATSREAPSATAAGHPHP